MDQKSGPDSTGPKTLRGVSRPPRRGRRAAAAGETTVQGEESSSAMYGPGCRLDAASGRIRNRLRRVTEDGEATVISIVIPALNEEKALPATLERVGAQAQSFEVIVVDGGSTDATRTIAGTDPRVRLVVAPRGRAAQ